MQKNLIAGTFLIALLSNCTENEIVKDVVAFETSEISFNSDKSNISIASQTIGIINFNNGKLNKLNEFIFTLSAEQSTLNNRDYDFNNTQVSITKIGVKKYEINANLNGIGLVKLTADLFNNSMSLKINEKTYVEKELSSLINEHHIAIITMSSILNDILFDNLSPYLNKSSMRIQCAYYGYTVGWGWTQEQSVDHESCVRESACETIEQYNCQYLGTSTSCGFGAIGCVTISTFKCDDGKAC